MQSPPFADKYHALSGGINTSVPSKTNVLHTKLDGPMASLRRQLQLVLFLS